jgi:hypothetical protein
VKEKWNIGLPILLMVVFAITRWPDLMPPNFSAAYGLVFCAGVYFPRRLSWWLPLATLFVTDVLVNVLHYHTSPVGAYMFVNYAVYGAIILLGQKFSAKAAWLSLVGGGLFGALIFYFITNTIAWLQDPDYAKTLAGWIQALTSGKPGWPSTWELFRNTLISGGLFSGLFAGAMKFSEAREAAEEDEPENEEEAEDATPEESQA